MKLGTIFALLILSAHSLAIECLDAPDSHDVEMHWNKATDVLFGQVLGGNYDDKTRRVSFSFRIDQSFKGRLVDTIVVQSPLYISANFALGQRYIIFLYGSQDIVPCAKTIELFPSVETLEDLRFHSRRDDIFFASDISTILRLIGNEP